MDYRVIEVKENILIENSKRADELRKHLFSKKVFMINVMASPGSGKTTLLTQLILRLKDSYRIGVIEADIDGEEDAKLISEKTGVKTMQIHTGGACHLTAQMVADALDEFGLDDVDLIFLENVGNLVCPAEFDTGANFNMMLLSVPEGHDKPLKYPLMFEVSKIAVITKIDTAPIFDFDFEKVEKNIHMRNKDAKVFKVSALENIGVDELKSYLIKLINLK